MAVISLIYPGPALAGAWPNAGPGRRAQCKI